MEKDIIIKIDEILEVGDFTEPNTLYLLAEIRKLFDKMGQDKADKYKLINFYSDWVVHAKLDRRPAKEMLRFLENGIHSGQGIAQEAFGFISFFELKKELFDFMKVYDLKREIFEQKWKQILNSLINIIADCPLENKNGNILKSFKFLKPSNQDSIDYEAKIDPANLPALNHGGIKIDTLKGTLLLS
jgi:hypothetical protein